MINFNDDIQTVLDYIKSHWKNTIRFEPDDKNTLLGLPYAYTVPCQTETTMQNNFYWDTCFTKLGLLRQGFHLLAKSNIDNWLFEVEKYGFVANGWPPLFYIVIKGLDNYFVTNLISHFCCKKF